MCFRPALTPPAGLSLNCEHPKTPIEIKKQQVRFDRTYRFCFASIALLLQNRFIAAGDFESAESFC